VIIKVWKVIKKVNKIIINIKEKSILNNMIINLKLKIKNRMSFYFKRGIILEILKVAKMYLILILKIIKEINWFL
jgi:hypothetical protein